MKFSVRPIDFKTDFIESGGSGCTPPLLLSSSTDGCYLPRASREHIILYLSPLDVVI